MCHMVASCKKKKSTSLFLPWKLSLWPHRQSSGWAVSSTAAPHPIQEAQSAPAHEEGCSSADHTAHPRPSPPTGERTESREGRMRSDKETGLDGWNLSSYSMSLKVQNFQNMRLKMTCGWWWQEVHSEPKYQPEKVKRKQMGERVWQKTDLLLFSCSQNISQDAVELFWCRRLEEVFQQGKQRGLNRLFFIRKSAAIFLHTMDKNNSIK